MMKAHVLLLALFVAQLERSAALEGGTCARLGGLCSNETPCCEKAHDCFAGKCDIAIYIPSHGEACDDKCGRPCSTRGESCVKGVCTGPDWDCSASGEECSVEKGCCNPSHDCVPLSETPLPPVWERAGVCKPSAAAGTGEKCDDKKPCRFRFDSCTAGVCKTDPAGLLDVSFFTEVKAKAAAFDSRPKEEGGCGKRFGCSAMRTRDGKVEPTSRWACSEKLGLGKCSLTFRLEHPQDIYAIKMAFHEGDAAKRSFKVIANQRYLGTFKTSGTSTDFERWTVDAMDVSEMIIEATDLNTEHWIHIMEVELLTRNQLGC